MYSIDKAKQAKIDSKIVNRNDFMVGHGKANSRDKLTRQVPGNGQKLDIKACENLYASNSIAMNYRYYLGRYGPCRLVFKN